MQQVMVRKKTFDKVIINENKNSYVIGYSANLKYESLFINIIKTNDDDSNEKFCMNRIVVVL
jgi:hypothetical protein